MQSRRFLLFSALGSFVPPSASNQMFGDAEAYERFMGRWSRLVAPLLLEFADVPDGWRVLDVGCGTGSLAAEIAARRPHCSIVGIDPSKPYIAYARAHVKNEKIRFEEGDAQDLNFPSASFDASLALLVFNFIPDPRNALDQLRRVTRPGGRIAAAVWQYDGGMRMLSLFWEAAIALDAAAENAAQKRMPLCRAGELTALWKAAGLVSVEERPLEITMRFQSFDDFWLPFLERQGPAGVYVASLTPERKTALRDQIRQLLPRRSSSGAFELPARVWAVRGTTPA